jgi:anti-sigma B factor antagonist
VRIELKFSDDIPILRLSGRFIAGGDGPFLRQKVIDLIEAGTRKLVIDFQEVPYLDSTGLGFLAGSQKVAQTAGATIVLAALNQHVRKVLDTAQLAQFFRQAADEAAALAMLKKVPAVAPGAEAATPPLAAGKTPRGRKRAEHKDSHGP